MASEKKIVAVSGGFDPVHVGHVRMFNEARSLGDELVVIVNNDHWLRSKKGYVFMPEEERIELIQTISSVDRVVLTEHAPDDVDRSVCQALYRVRPHIFANGGDRFRENTPEEKVCKELEIEMVFGVGRGGKVQSSSNLVALSQHQVFVQKPWGSFRTFLITDGACLKTLHLNQNARLSLQRHVHRNETWLLLSGDVQATYGDSPENLVEVDLRQDVPVFIPAGMLHRLASRNGGVVAEVSSGMFDERDIERIEDDYGRA